MVRLGMQLSFRSGREALVQAVMIAVAVAIGVTVLLAVLAGYHAYQATSGRACWECTTGVPGDVPSPHSELWDYSENLYKGQFIELLEVASLGPGAPVPPGITRLPAPGEYFASPALAHLVNTVPKGELADRFPGRAVGTISYQALAEPNSLVAIVGYPAAKLATLPGTRTVDRISTAPDAEGTTGIYRLALQVGAVIVLFPMLILINAATRLSAARREERFAAMRLVGATPGQVNAIASVESAFSALGGAVLGTALFIALRPALAGISFSGARFFERFVTPTVPGYLLVLLGVPLVATASALWSLRRARISPLAVSVRVTPPPPRMWRVAPLAIGVPLFVLPLLGGHGQQQGNKAPAPTPVFIGVLLIMIGLVASGSWLTMQVARALARTSRGASSLLAARRLADNPKGAFRAVGGLVLAVFVGSLLASIIPVVNSAQTSLGGTARSLTDVLRAPYEVGPASGLNPRQAAAIIDELRGQPGTTVLAIYTNPIGSATASGPPPLPSPPTPPSAVGRHRHRQADVLRAPTAPSPDAQYDSIVSCAGLGAFLALGSCGRGAKAVYANIQDDFLTDNPLTITLPVVTASNPPATLATGSLALGAMLVKTTSAALLEKDRTLITLFNNKVVAGGGLSNWQMGNVEPETFGEVAQIRNNDDNNAEAVVLALVALTLFVAACSLAVAVAGGIVERKRPFTLMRLSGTPARTLYKVVVLESVLPLVAAAVLAAATGIGIAIPLVKALPEIHQPALALPGPGYFLAMGVGLLVALAVVSSVLPLLGRSTQPNDARFE